jgi:hypothetical protein
MINIALLTRRVLSEGVHTVEIDERGIKDSAATDSYLYVDGVHYSRPTYASLHLETMSDANARVQYGAFSIDVSAAASGVTTVTSQCLPQQHAPSRPRHHRRQQLDGLGPGGLNHLRRHSHPTPRRHHRHATISGSWLAIG